MLALTALLAAILVPAASAASSVPAPSPCAAVKGLGCSYVPASLRGKAGVPVLVFLRGVHPYFGEKVPVAELPGSARRAVDLFKLRELADAQGLALLVTGSPQLSVGAADLEAFAAASGTGFGRVLLASHSGGYRGLAGSLDRLPALARVLMLDNFYFDYAIANQVRTAVERGASCAGFLTPHNENAYLRVLKPIVECRVEALAAAEHNTGVARCLGAFTQGRACLAPVATVP